MVSFGMVNIVIASKAAATLKGFLNGEIKLGFHLKRFHEVYACLQNWVIVLGVVIDCGIARSIVLQNVLNVGFSLTISSIT